MTEQLTHAVPLLEGRQSRRHQRVTYDDLRAGAAAYASSGSAPELSGVQTLVQFAGFPRSGHSLVGSMVDAHPDAVVAHELDLMGLVEQGFDATQLFSSVCQNSAEFERHGRWWNGYCYRVDGGSGGTSPHPLVLGDKKADWAVRRVRREPALLERLTGTIGEVRSAWVVVVRNPFDNVATMSLRKGRRYDQIRINAGSPQQFRRRLERAQDQHQSGDVSAAVLPEMVDDYALLCEGVALMKERIPAADWFELRHEDLVAAPELVLQRLLDFLRLPPCPGVSRGCATMVSTEVNRTRHQVTWSPPTREQVQQLTNKYSFLASYDFDD